MAIDLMTDPIPRKRARIYSVVALIPEGRVATYGDVAAMAGLPRQARQVGYALAALPYGHDLPWHRVINAKGEISRRANGECDPRQRARLESEGVAFDSSGRVSLARFRWRPERSRDPAQQHEPGGFD
jgi:methylated-DNA-protein-cysteine methyltransferase-like protein